VTEERPEERDESDPSVAPSAGADGQEARRGPDPDAPFPGLRSAADIFGAPITEEEWPSRRERREAERAARQAGQPEPEPFTAPSSVPQADLEHETDGDETDGDEPGGDEPGGDESGGRSDGYDPGATQAISMPEELALPGGVAGRVPPPAAVPPVSNAPDPRAISLPTARTDRDVRAAESRAIEDERRRTDPDGLGRSDVDWLGRARSVAGTPDMPAATPLPPALRGGPEAQPLGVQDTLPPSSEPPTFTELLRLGDDVEGAPKADRPFDWSLMDDQTGEVPTTLTRDAFDTNLVAAESWTTQTPAATDPAATDSDPAADDPAAADPILAADRADEHSTPSGSSWSLSDEAARTGEVFPGDVDDGVRVRPTAAPTVPQADDGDDLDGDDLDDDLDDHVASPTAAFSPRAAAAVPPPSVLPTPAVPRREEDDADRGSAIPPLVEPGRWAGHEPTRAQSTPAWPTPAQPDPAPADPSGRDDDLDRGPRGISLEDLDQSEWQGRETSDTGVIKDLFGTEAIQQLRDADAHRPEDTSTRMMPAVAAAPPAGRGAVGSGAAGAGAPGTDRDNFINEGFARLQSEGRRGKQLLVYGSIAIIVVLLLLVLVVTTWIRSNAIEEPPASPSSSPAAALSVQPPGAITGPTHLS
jgi:hypothetical protein